MIRVVTDFDRATLRQWGKARGVSYPWLPAFGLMDEHVGLFLVASECPHLGFIEVAIGNPESTGRQIYKSLRAVASELVAQARKQGYTRILAISSIKGVIAAAQHSGATTTTDQVTQWEL